MAGPLKPYYEQDGITIYHGDSEELLPSLSADVLITDPPYGFGSYTTDIQFDPFWLRLWVKRFAAIAVFGYPELLCSWCVIAGLQPSEWIVWRQTNAGGARCGT